ncbi:hypothetical protein TNCV_4078791 [Trichonephila clavipes]|nr:hypothetical protein TNCV_4078791 [Trichonephila clavipes]
MYRRPYFRPSYRRYDIKPRVFPPYAQQLMPPSQENTQVFFPSQGLAVLCIRNNGFTLTNLVVSYAMDRYCPNELFRFLHYLNVGTICVTDQHSKQTFKKIQASWSSSSQFKGAPVMLLNSNERQLGQCPFCNQNICHRWIAVQVHDGPNRCIPRAHFNDRGARDAVRETRRIGICARYGQVRACIIYQEPNTKRVFVLFCKDN